MIRGSKRSVVTPCNVDIRASIHNRFDIEVIDSKTGLVRQKAVAHNVICNQLWTYLFNTSSNTFNYFNYIFYGGGTGSPSASDTSLFSHIGGAQAGSLVRSIDIPNGVYSCKKSIQLTASAAAGRTITEVGIAYSSGTSTLCTHAMLKDMNGNAVSIQKTDTDVVNIYATVFVHYDPDGYDNKSILVNYIDETDRTYGYDLLGWLAGTWPTGRLLLSRAEFSNYGGFGLKYANQSGVNFRQYTMKSISKSFDVANRKCTMNVGRIEAANANYGGIRTVGIFGRWEYGSDGDYMDLQIVLQPGGSWFPVSTVTGESIGVGDGVTSDYAFDFHFAKNVKVYIDGVETTDFTIDYAPNSTDGWGWYMEGLHKDSTPDRHIRMFYNPSYATNSAFYDKDIYFYNPMHEIGLASISFYCNGYSSGASSTVYASNDMVEWTPVGTGKLSSYRATVNIGSDYRKYKYWKITKTEKTMHIDGMTAPSSYTGKALHFNTPPTSGAVITADYECDVIAKDANNVFDLSLTIQLGELTE